MPGTILDIPVAQGHLSKKGDILMILEAMKWKMKSSRPADGVVAQIAVQRGASVNPAICWRLSNKHRKDLEWI